MAAIFSSLLDSTTTESLLWWASRATLIAGVAWAFLALARRARPATRHMVAIGSLVAVAILPVASALLPNVSLPVLPAPTPKAVVAPEAPRAVPFAIDAPAPAATPAPAIHAVTAPAPRVTPSTPGVTAPAAPAKRESAATIGSVIGSTLRTVIRSIDLGTLAMLTWLTVAASLLLWTLLGAIGAQRLSRRALSVDNDTLRIECERACRVLGITRTVDVVVSSDVEIPMVVGALNPRVVVPTSAAAWSPERLRVVLLHELAHVRRHDVRWMLVARVVTSIFWFHPLVWVLSQHARRDAERACDEIVLMSGVRGSDYAEHLVAIARTAMTRDPMAGSALAFATRSSLERRVVAILATRVTRAAASRRARLATIGASVLLLGTIAAVEPTRGDAERIVTVKTHTNVETHVATIENVNVVRNAPAPEIYLANDNDDDRSGREWYGRAQSDYNSRRFERSAEAYEQAALRGYRRGTAFYNAGCSWALADEKDKAIAALQKSFDEGFDRPDLFAEDEDLNSLRGDARFQKLLDQVMNSGTAEAERREATRDFERLAKAKEVDEGEWNSIGIQLLRSGDYDGAAKAFDNEFAVSKDEDALYNKACARSLSGKTDEAIKLLEQSIISGTVDADHMQEDPDLIPLHSAARFDQLVEMAEDLELHNTGWWKNLPGDWSWNSGKDERRWRKAIPHFEEMTRKYPKVGRAWSNLGYAQLAGKEAKASTASLQKALDLGYRPSTTMYNLACAEAQSGNIDASIAWLEKADAGGFEMWQWARWDDDLDPIRDDPRYEKMEKRWKAEAKKRGHDEWDWDHHKDDDDDDRDDT